MQSVAKSAHGFKIVDHVIVILKIINTVFKIQTRRRLKVSTKGIMAR